jgi:hypothetical protein
MDPDAQAIIKRVGDNCKLLYEGYSEGVEFVVDVAYHRYGCEYHGKSHKPKGCDCTVTREKRVRSIRRPGYLEQLREFAQHKDTDRNAKAERGAPRVKTAGRPPGDLGGFFALDELECDIPTVVDRALEEAGRDRSWAVQPVRLILIGLASQVAEILADGRPDVARDLDLAARRWVESARSTLKITVGDSMFDAVTCGNCGGALSTPWGNQGDADVRCIGTPTDPPCGETYPPGEWLRLYEDHKRREGRS